MSDSHDDRIRELFEELDRASPEAPRLPKAPRPVSAPWWQRGMVPAMGVAVVVLVIGVGSQLFPGSTDSADEATETTEAAAEGGDGPVDTRPPDFALVLVDLNLACTAFVDASGSAVQTAPVSDQEHLDALNSLVVPTADLASEVSAAAGTLSDPALEVLSGKASLLVSSIEDGADGSASDAPGAYRRYVDDVEALGSGLETYGALECGRLAESLP